MKVTPLSPSHFKVDPEIVALISPSFAGISFSQVTVGTGELSSAFALVLGVFFSMNLLLFVLNMLPVPPLDGSSALLLVIPRAQATAYQMWMAQPLVSWIGILLVFRYVGEIFVPIFFTCVGWLYPGVSYGS